MVKFRAKFLLDFLWSLILTLIFLRPFLSAYAYPYLEKYYRLLLLTLSIFLILLIHKPKKKYFNADTRKSMVRLRSPLTLSEVEGSNADKRRFSYKIICDHLRYLPAGQAGICENLRLRKVFQISLFNYSFLLFIVAIFVSTIFSINRQASLEQILNFLPCFAIFYLMYQVNEKQKKQVITTMIIAASIIGIYTLYQFLFGLRHTLEYLQKTTPYPYAEEFLGRKRAFATFFSPDMLAGYLAIMIPLSLGFMLEKLFFNADLRKSNADKRRFIIGSICDHLRAICENLRFWIIPVILLTALFLTKSLGGILSLAVSLFVFIYLLKLPNKKSIFILAILIFILILPMLLLRASSFLDFRNPQNTIIQRLRYWTAALRIIKDHPLFGVGLGNFANVYLRYKLPYATEIRFVHNSYLQIWAETGILGIIGLLGMIFSFLRKALKLKKNFYQVGLISAAVAFLFHNLLDFSFFISEVALNWWVILGLVIAENIRHS